MGGYEKVSESLILTKKAGIAPSLLPTHHFSRNGDVPLISETIRSSFWCLPLRRESILLNNKTEVFLHWSDLFVERKYYSPGS